MLVTQMVKPAENVGIAEQAGEFAQVGVVGFQIAQETLHSPAIAAQAVWLESGRQ